MKSRKSRNYFMEDSWVQKIFLPEVSVSDGEDILVVQLNWLIVGQDFTIQLCVVSLGQGNDVNLTETFNDFILA